MIERWEDPTRRLLELRHEAPYSIGKLHKHIPEIMRYGGLNTEPQFLPAVGPFRCGMRVQVTLPAKSLPSPAQEKQCGKPWCRDTRMKRSCRSSH